MKEKIKNMSGITLIALVITIIVMLILVTVTIRVATNGNLFTHAANAAKATNAHIQNETAILNDDLGIEDIVAEQTGEGAATLIHFTIAGTSYDAEEGMTWEEWFESDYNINNLDYYCSLSDQTLISVILIPAGNDEFEEMEPEFSEIHLDDPIVSGQTYQ